VTWQSDSSTFAAQLKVLDANVMCNDLGAAAFHWLDQGLHLSTRAQRGRLARASGHASTF
jgi:hypothetical protein